jgi:peptide chain release factor 1
LNFGSRTSPNLHKLGYFFFTVVQQLPQIVTLFMSETTRKMIKIKSPEETIAEIVGMANLLNRRYLKSQKQSDWCQRVLSTYYLWQQFKTELIDAQALAIEQTEDIEWRSTIDREIIELESKIADLRHQIDILLVDIHPYQHRDVLVEIRALTGGDDAGIWVEDLVKIYTRYAEENKWKVALVSASMRELFGLNSAILEIQGAFVGCFFQFETGIHQVNRRSAMEFNADRVDASTAIVTVMPIVYEDEIELDLHDIEASILVRSYHLRNKYRNSVYWFHKPTGIRVFCDLLDCQRKNKEKALQILLSKLSDREIQKQLGETDRSRIVRTYDYGSNLAIDLSSGMSFPLDRVLNGELELSIASHLTNHPIV